MTIIFHPEIHGCPGNNKIKQKLVDSAKNNEIYLLLESQEYSNDDANIKGLETNVNCPILQIVSTIRLSQMPYKKVSDAGDHGYYTINNFFITVGLFPEIEFGFMGNLEKWQCGIEFFRQHLNITAQMTMNEKTKEVGRIGRLYGGYPGDLTFEFIYSHCVKILHTKTKLETEIESIINKYMMTDREASMAKNILDLQSKTKKDIHIIIGAGHLCPKITIDQLEELGLNNSMFLDHQRRIQGPRLVELIGDCEIHM